MCSFYNNWCLLDVEKKKIQATPTNHDLGAYTS